LSEQMQMPEAVEARGGRISVLATVGLFIFLSGVLAYAYPHFLPGPPEQAVKRFLVAHQAGTWDYVQLAMDAPMQLEAEYVRAASRCRLVGFEVADSFPKRLRWASGRLQDEETLKMHEYYATGKDDRTVRVTVDYVLERRGGEWFIELDSIVGEGGIERYLHARGVMTVYP